MATRQHRLIRTMTTPPFSVTWDYRCPFAYKVHDHLVEALEAGADWDVRFVPFSLGQVHVAEGETPIWDRPADDTGLLALQAGVVVRDQFPNRFLIAHRALFRARHEAGLAIRERAVVGDALTASGVDADAVFAAIETGEPLEAVRKEHESAVADHQVWGVPTFITGDQAAFVRLMNGATDGAESIAIIERLVDQLAGWPELNEFKHTSIPR
jgi:2-hydroxychromene-2-carboxylate isomerase